MASTFRNRIQKLIKYPPDALRGNPFHFTKWVRFTALFDATEQVLRLNTVAVDFDLAQREHEGLNYWVRQAAIATCAAIQAYPRYFEHFQPQFQLRADDLLQRLAQALGMDSVDDLQLKFREDIQALHDEAPRVFFRDPEVVKNA